MASHFGGTRQGLAISWPGHIDVGGIRTQFHHVIDIVPTILEAAGIPAPDMVNGIKQKPMEGVSMAYTFDQTNATAPSKRGTQYFEMVGNRAIYHDGWVAATTPPFPPWAMGTGKLPDVLNGYTWELYNIASDFSEYNDLAATNPSKLKELQTLFMTEAGKYQVFPMDNVLLARLVTERPSATAGQTEFTYTGENSGIPVANAPSILDKDYTITADITVPSGDAEGMIVTMGGRFGGYGLFLSHSWNWFLKNHSLELAILGLFIFGALLTLFGKNRHWKTWKLSFGYAMLAVVGLWVVAVLATSVFGLGRGRPIFTYNLLDLERFRWRGPSLAAGKHTIVFDFKYDGPGPAKAVPACWWWTAKRRTARRCHTRFR